MIEQVSLWDYLKTSDKPIVMYGTGNGADKIMDVLIGRNIPLSAIFASDGYVRHREFRGYPVLSYSQVIEIYGEDIIVLLAFGTTIPSLVEFIEELDTRHELLIPDVPLYGGDLFDSRYYNEHKTLLENTLSLLADETSRQVFEDAIQFRLTGKLKYLKNTHSFDDSIKEIFSSEDIHTIIDGGAYKGDSTQILAETLSSREIYAIEADPRTYLKLCEYASNETHSHVIPLSFALGEKNESVNYVSSASRGSSQSGRNKRAITVPMEKKTIDSVFADTRVDLIKLDIEGYEKEALIGSLETIKKNQPNLCLSLYHRTDDLFELVQLTNNLLPNHKLYVRRTPCIPLWDLCLFAKRSV